MDPDPIYTAAITRILQLMDEARARGDHDVQSAALATATLDGRPSIRTVSVVRIGASGLLFFANTQTGKGRQMLSNPRVALCFHWLRLQYQVLLEGPVAMLCEAESDAQWRKVPRDYSLGHWASDQTRTDAVPAQLHQNVREYRDQFDWQSVPRPPSWRAFEVAPDRIELWPSSWKRLRARERHVKSADGHWISSSANP